jgi:hypothetical protein
MKYFICIAIFFLFPFVVHAVETNASVTATPIKNQQVEDLKERLATKVAQLRQSERRAIYGKVKSSTISTLTIETANKDIKIELTDDIKVFQTLKGKRTTLAVEDVAKDDIVSVFGDWDTTVEVLKAKVIFIHNTSEVINRIVGTISESKKADYTITITSQDGKTYIIDFETATKTNVWTKEKGVEKGGFSKLLSGDTILVVGTAVPKKENRISALRILNIGNLTGEKPTPTPTAAEKEATGSSTKPSANPTKSLTPAQ